MTTMMKKKKSSTSISMSPSIPSSENASNNNCGLLENAYFMKWKLEDVLGVVRYHPIPCVFAACMLFFMGVEYTLRMIPSSSPPFDLGFVATLPLNRLLASRPSLNNFLAGLNTVENNKIELIFVFLMIYVREEIVSACIAILTKF